MANGVARPSEHALNRSPKVWNPRVGVAWDVNGKGDWLVRGGFGFYSNWLTPANIQEQFRGNPPGLILPTFFANSPSPPIFTQGTGSVPPFGFNFPGLAGTSLCPTAPCLDEKGGIKGAAFPIGAINPDIDSPKTYIYSATLEHQIGSHLVASLLYSGSHTSGMVSGGNQIGQVSYGTNINAMPGDLLTKPPGSAPTRLNSSFGPIAYYRQRSRGQLQRHHLRPQGAVQAGVLRRLVHPLLLEGRRRRLPDVDQPPPVLWAVSVGRSQSLLPQRQLRAPGWSGG